MSEDILKIRTDDGVMPVERFAGRRDAAVIVYMDGFGVRDELREMCRRFARMGYTTFLPNMYYRLGGPSFLPPNASGAKSPQGAQAANRATTVAMTVHDTRQILKAESSIEHWAVVGYCMGGRHAIGAAATQPDKVKACLSVHGGNMIFDGEWSCERQIPRCNAELFLGFAKDDPSCTPIEQNILRDALMQRGVSGRADVFDAAHGWSFADRHCFDHVAAEAVWTIAREMFARRLRS